MTTCVALLRGINIGAKKRIAMADLKDLVGDLGYGNVRTLVNSGNVVFEVNDDPTTNEIAGTIKAAILERTGLKVPVIVRTGDEMRAIVDRNPFPEAAVTPKLLHVSFLGEPPDPDLVTALEEAERGEDDFRVIDREVYLFVRNGLSGATFNVNGLDRALRQTATSRNWNTVTKLADMAADG